MWLLARIFGGSLMVVGGAFVAMAVVEAATGGDGHTSGGVYAGLVVFFSGVAYGGWRLWRAPASSSPSQAGAQPEFTAFDVEQRILAAGCRFDDGHRDERATHDHQ